MLRARLCLAFHAGCIGVIALAGSARGQDLPATVSEIAVPGGLTAALKAINDPVPADRAQFLLESIRRFYSGPVVARTNHDAALHGLLDHLDQAGGAGQGSAAGPDTVPLPLTPEIWADAVFHGAATPQTLVRAILQSRSASILYCALLSLDDETRRWMGTEPALLGDVAARHYAPFFLAAPGLRVAGGAVRVPGGDPALPGWEALTGRRASEPAEFVRALLTSRDGRVAYFLGSMAQLTPAQIRTALNLDSPDASYRVETARRLFGVFDRISATWSIDDRPFWRPAMDPALLVADLSADAAGRPIIAGTRRFWNAAFANDQPGGDYGGRQPREDRATGDDQPVDFATLCEQIFKVDNLERRRRYQAVLFASRTVRQVTSATERDALDAVRGASSYPAVVASLERARVSDIAPYAAAVRRASQLSTIADTARQTRAIAQFQGTLAIVLRAASRGSLPAASLPGLVSSLAAVDFSERGDYDGKIARWIDANLRNAVKIPAAGTAVAQFAADIDQNAPGPVEADLLRLLSGPPPAAPRFVNWEGTRYLLDLRSAEAARLVRLLGDDPRPYLSSAHTIVGIADALEASGLTRDALRQQAAEFEPLAEAPAWNAADEGESTGEARDRYRQASAAVQRASRDGDVAAAPRLAAALRVCADDLLARGLQELAYAVALGQSDRGSFSAAEASSRHDFGLKINGVGRSGPWRLPLAGSSMTQSWHALGALLGLDVTLAEFSLVRLSAKPPLRKPTLNESDRRVFVEAVALVEPALLGDDDRDAIVSAIARGRTRLAAARTPRDAAAIADGIRLSAVRRTLLSWIVTRDPGRLAAFLSPAELLWLGLEKNAPRLDAWGAPSEERDGCLCLQMINRRPWESFTGRWGSGVFATGFPDLNLRLAELLADLRMPAALLGPVLASATLDLVNNTTSRDQDDRRGLVEFVASLRREQVEQYLAFLTTDGPLVPAGEATGAAEGGERIGTPR